MNSSLKPTTSATSLWCTFEGRIIDGKYHLGRLISSGSFGGVFEADEVVADQLIRRVAIKLITPDAELPERQMQELALATRLDHPNVLRCFSPGACAVNGLNLLYIVMELASKSLSDRLTEGVLDHAEAHALADAILSAVVYLASGDQPMVHRDLKPANILCVHGAWKLADFGLLRGIGPERVAQTRTLLGTAEYAPPEAFEGTVSTAWDVWSVGVIVVEAVTGALPFDEPTPQEMQKAILEASARHIDELPLALADIVRGCLTKERAKRWTAAQALGVLRGTASAPAAPGPTSFQREMVERRAKYPFRFKFGAAETLLDFINLCEQYPYEAQDYLMNRYVARWMTEALDDPALAREAYTYGQMHWHEPERAIELFIRELRRMAGLPFDPDLIALPDRLDIGLLAVGERKSLSVKYRCKARGHVWGKTRIEGNLPGLSPDATFGIADAPVPVHLDTVEVPPGYYEGELLLDAFGLQEPLRIPVTYTVVPVKAKISPTSVNLGTVVHGQTASQPLEIASLPEKARIKGKASIVPPTPGLSVTPDFGGDRVRLEVVADAAQLEAGREYVRRIRLDTTAGAFEIPVRVQTTIRYKTAWVYTLIMALGIGAIGCCLRGVIAASLADPNHWFVAPATTADYDTVFRLIGGPLFAAGIAYLFRLVAKQRYPLYYEQRERERLALLSRSQPQRPNAGEPVPPVRILGVFVVLVATMLCYNLLPLIGQIILLTLDRTAFGMRWLDVNAPAIAWALMCGLVGAVAGFAMGMRRAGAPKLAPGIATYGAGALVCLFVLGLIYSGVMPPTHPQQVMPNTNHSINFNFYTP